MKIKTVRILTFSICILSLAGCSEYNKLLKSRDYNAMWIRGQEYYEAKKYTKAIQLFEESRQAFRYTSTADTLEFYLATAYFRQGDFASSGMLFGDYRMNYSGSPFLEEAEYMYAKGFYYDSPPANRDQTATNRALIAIDEYLLRYPESPQKEALEDNIRELNDKLDDKAYINAKLYYTTGKYKSAVVALKNAINKYPDSRHREELMYLAAKSNFLLAENSISVVQRDRYMDMMDAYYTFISEYPESLYRKELDKMQDVARAFIDRFSDLEPEITIEE